VVERKSGSLAALEHLQQLASASLHAQEGTQLQMPSVLALLLKARCSLV